MSTQQRNAFILVGVIAAVSLCICLASASAIGSVAETSRELATIGAEHPAFPGPNREVVLSLPIEELQGFVLDDSALIMQLIEYIEFLTHGYEELRTALLYAAAINFVLVCVVVVHLRRLSGARDAA